MGSEMCIRDSRDNALRPPGAVAAKARAAAPRQNGDRPDDDAFGHGDGRHGDGSRGNDAPQRARAALAEAAAAAAAAAERAREAEAIAQQLRDLFVMRALSAAGDGKGVLDPNGAGTLGGRLTREAALDEVLGTDRRAAVRAALAPPPPSVAQLVGVAPSARFSPPLLSAVLGALGRAAARGGGDVHEWAHQLDGALAARAPWAGAGSPGGIGGINGTHSRALGDLSSRQPPTLAEWRMVVAPLEPHRALRSVLAPVSGAPLAPAAPRDAVLGDTLHSGGVLSSRIARAEPQAQFTFVRGPPPVLTPHRRPPARLQAVESRSPLAGVLL